MTQIKRDFAEIVIKIYKYRLRKKNCERKMVVERMWKKDCEGKIVKEIL